MRLRAVSFRPVGGRPRVGRGEIWVADKSRGARTVLELLLHHPGSSLPPHRPPLVSKKLPLLRGFARCHFDPWAGGRGWGGEKSGWEERASERELCMNFFPPPRFLTPTAPPTPRSDDTLVLLLRRGATPSSRSPAPKRKTARTFRFAPLFHANWTEFTSEACRHLRTGRLRRPCRHWPATPVRCRSSRRRGTSSSRRRWSDRFRSRVRLRAP